MSEETKPHVPLTYGEKAVGLLFNPSGTDAVYECKRRFADAIDQLEQLIGETDDLMRHNLIRQAITEMQTAQMWAVKALTWKA